MKTQLVATKALEILYTSKKIDLGIGKTRHDDGYYYAVPMAFFMNPNGTVKRTVVLRLDDEDIRKFPEIVTMYISKMPKDNDEGVVEITIVTTIGTHVFKLSQDKNAPSVAACHRYTPYLYTDERICGDAECDNIIITDHRVRIDNIDYYVATEDDPILFGCNVGNRGFLIITRTRILYSMIRSGIRSCNLSNCKTVDLKQFDIQIDHIEADACDHIAVEITEKAIVIGAGRTIYFIKLPESLSGQMEMLCSLTLLEECGFIRELSLHGKCRDTATSIMKHLVILTESGIMIHGGPLCIVDGLIGIGSYKNTLRVYVESVEVMIPVAIPVSKDLLDTPSEPRLRKDD